jgi:hypothetical protein
MEGFGLPMSFGKKTKAAPVNMTAKLEKSKRVEEVSLITVSKLTSSRQRPRRSRSSSLKMRRLGMRRMMMMMMKSDRCLLLRMSRGRRQPRKKRRTNLGLNRMKRKKRTRCQLVMRLYSKTTPKYALSPFRDSSLIIKVVSAIAVDPSGARIATGSHDYDTKLWDFGGMDSRLKPFKSFEANGNYHVCLPQP